MPLPKIESSEQITLPDGKPARKLVKVVKLSEVDPTAPGRLTEIVAEAKTGNATPRSTS